MIAPCYWFMSRNRPTPKAGPKNEHSNTTNTGLTNITRLPATQRHGRSMPEKVAPVALQSATPRLQHTAGLGIAHPAAANYHKIVTGLGAQISSPEFRAG
jgi:hypothetical protein